MAIVARVARHFNTPPDLLGDEQIKAYLLHHIRQSKWKPSPLNVAVGALRQFYHLVCGRSMEDVEKALPRAKGRVHRPQVYSADELERMFQAPELNPKHRVLIMTAYAAGLRASEVCHLKAGHILSDRMQIRVGFLVSGSIRAEHQQLTMISGHFA